MNEDGGRAVRVRKRWVSSAGDPLGQASGVGRVWRFGLVSHVEKLPARVNGGSVEARVNRGSKACFGRRGVRRSSLPTQVLPRLRSST